jgi:glycosyltransferase involved in cell wall biosynthesis
MEKHSPLVSVCMPAYNAEKYIGDAIKSVINQSYKNWELIIVNDGSTDGTLKVIDEFSDNRIRVFTQQNRVQCAAANKAFELSRGQLIKFFDADDILSLNMLSTQVARISGHQEDVVSASWGRFYNNDIKTFQLSPEPVWQDMCSVDWVITALTTGNAVMQCALWLIPRSTLERSGLWDEELSLINDFDFFIRVLVASKNVLFEPRATMYYRSGVNGSLSSQIGPQHALSAFRSISKGAKALFAINQTPAAKRAVANSFQQLAYSLYPHHKKLVLQIESEIEKLGGSTITWQYSRISAVLNSLLGWKASVRLITAIRKISGR